MRRFVNFIVLGVMMMVPIVIQAAPLDEIPSKERCPVCGMFVAKYRPWLSQLHYDSQEIVMFDGVKDMMAYYFQPDKYGGKGSAKVLEIHVKDYYSQKWIDGKEALYVIGSDVYGPMGHELIPFSSKAAADNFLKDHHGKEIINFQEITLERINIMRKGMTMKGHK